MIREMIHQAITVIDSNGHYPVTKEISQVSRDGLVVRIHGKEYVNFASNSYLGFSQHPKIIEAITSAARDHGIGTGGSRVTVGSQSLHREVERRIAAFKGSEDAVVFTAGYLANSGVLPAITCCPLRGMVTSIDPSAEEIFQPIDVFLDALVHASIIDGLAVASSRIFGTKIHYRFYRHLDMEHLDELLAKSSAPGKLVVTDGVFSLHGHLAPLDKIVEIARRHQASVYVDDAHGTGVLGANGRGTPEHFGVEDGVDFTVGTFSKALGVSGGYITDTEEVCHYFRIACRTSTFQTSMPPALAAGLIAAIDLMEQEPERRYQLEDNRRYVSNALADLGFDTLNSETQIIPVRFWEVPKARAAMEYLMEQGLFAPFYLYPAVRKDEAMVRINLMSVHTLDHLNQLLDALSYIGKKLDVLHRTEVACC